MVVPFENIGHGHSVAVPDLIRFLFKRVACTPRHIGLGPAGVSQENQAGDP